MYIMIYTCTYFRYLYNEVSNWIQMTNHIVKQGDSLYMLIRKLLLLGMNKKYQVLSSGLWKDTKWYCAVNQFCCMYQKKKITVDVNTWICDIFIGSLYSHQCQSNLVIFQMLKLHKFVTKKTYTCMRYMTHAINAWYKVKTASQTVWFHWST